MDEEVIRIKDIIYVLLRRMKLIVSVTILATLSVGLISFFCISPKYEVSTKLFIGKENKIQGQEQVYNDNDVQMYQKLLKTYAEVITTNDLIDNAIKNHNIDIDSQEILDNLKVTPREDTQILEINYIGKNIEESKKIIELITDKFVERSEELIPNGNVKVIESAKVPEKPVSPNKRLNMIIAFFLGLMGSIGLAFLLEYLNDTFNSKEETEKVLGLPVIGAIPDDM